jgi:hypothetical protein
MPGTSGGHDELLSLSAPHDAALDLLAQHDAVARRDPEQLGRAPHQIRLEFVHLAVASATSHSISTIFLRPS